MKPLCIFLVLIFAYAPPSAHAQKVKTFKAWVTLTDNTQLRGYLYSAGDEALVAIARAIRSSMRNTDRLYRYGGEEILLLLPEISGKDALVAAERVRKAVQALQIPHAESPFGHVTISIGVASEQGDGWQELVNRADQALYHAKEAKRNCVYGETT